MRVTEELKSKIAEALAKKYAPEIKAVEDSYKAFIEKVTPELLQELATVCDEHPLIAEILNDSGYNYSYNTRKKSHENIIHNYLHRSNCKEYNEYTKARNAIYSREKQERDTIIIKLTYLKDYDAIKAVFNELGFSL